MTTMTTLTYSKQDTDLINRWLQARDNEKKAYRTDYGTSPSVPASLMLEIAQRIWRKRRDG